MDLSTVAMVGALAGIPMGEPACPTVVIPLRMGNMPVTRLFRQGGRFMPYGSMLPLPGMPQFPQFDIEQGFTGLDTEKFRLPGKEEYKAPRNFREEILDSLKQGVPPQMKEQIERYFKNLSE